MAVIGDTKPHVPCVMLHVLVLKRDLVHGLQNLYYVSGFDRTCLDALDLVTGRAICMEYCLRAVCASHLGLNNVPDEFGPQCDGGFPECFQEFALECKTERIEKKGIPHGVRSSYITRG